MTESLAARPSFKVKPLFGCAAIIFAIYLILFSGAPNYTESKAEENLAHFSSLLTQAAKIIGYESRLQYSSVQIQGFAYEKWAKISKLSVDMSREAWLGSKRFGISSDNAQLIPNPLQLNRAQLKFPEAINLIMGSDLLYVINHTLPILYSSGKNIKDEGVDHNLTIEHGNMLTLSNPENTLNLKFDDGYGVNITLAAPYNNAIISGHGGEVELLKDTHQWDIDSSRFHFSITQKSPKTAETRGTLTLEDLSYTTGDISTKPISLNAAWVYNETRGMTGSLETSEFIIERSVITDDDLHIAVSGTLDFSMDEAMPYGEVILEVNDLKLLAASNWIADSYRDKFTSMLKEITDEDIVARSHGTIPIRRKKGGEWYVGRVSFKSLLDKGLLDFLIFNQVPKNETASQNQKHAS